MNNFVKFSQVVKRQTLFRYTSFVGNFRNYSMCRFRNCQNDPDSLSQLPVTFEDISRAHYRIQSGIRRTHCDKSQFLSEICGCTVYLKKDFTQFTGSFKERGGRNSLMMLPENIKNKGVITASAGNHALALAWHGKDLNIPVTCVMPVTAPITKVEKCRKFGANVVLHGSHIGEAKEFAQREYADLKYINGYDDPEIIAGAGTMGIEILEQINDGVDVILVPVGGAGLIAGVSLAVKTLRPHIEVIGVEPENVASYVCLFKMMMINFLNKCFL